MDLFTMVTRRFKKVFSKQEQMRTFPIYDASIEVSHWKLLHALYFANLCYFEFFSPPNSRNCAVEANGTGISWRIFQIIHTLLNFRNGNHLTENFGSKIVRNGTSREEIFFWLARVSGGNTLGWKILLKIAQLPLNHLFWADCSFLENQSAVSIISSNIPAISWGSFSKCPRPYLISVAWFKGAVWRYIQRFCCTQTCLKIDWKLSAKYSFHSQEKHKTSTRKLQWSADGQNGTRLKRKLRIKKLTWKTSARRFSSSSPFSLKQVANNKIRLRSHLCFAI